MGASVDALDRLLEHIERGDETDLYRIQIRPLARAWGVDEDALLLAEGHGVGGRHARFADAGQPHVGLHADEGAHPRRIAHTVGAEDGRNERHGNAIGL